MTAIIQIFSSGALPGALRASDTNAGGPLHHAVADRPFAVGRLRRAVGEALCNKTLELVDPLGWKQASAIDCPRCGDITGRLLGPTVTRFRSDQSVFVEAHEHDRPSDRQETG
jgi:hypothetical protein